MHIYDGEHSVHRILEECTVETRGIDPPPGVVDGVDLAKLNTRLNTIDVPEIRRRRARMELFFQDIMVDANVDTGIGFTSCLMILAHYNVISDSKSLRLEEYLRRRVRLQRVEEEVRRRVVRGFFDTMYWARRFRSRLNLRQSATMKTVPQFAVPEIFIEDEDANTLQTAKFQPSIIGELSSPDNTRNRMSLDVGGLRRRADTSSVPPQADRSSPNSPNSFAYGPSSSVGSANFQWADGATDGSAGNRSRTGSSVSPQDVLNVFDNSAWGESIRRSFTIRRNGTRERGGGNHD